jgi:16S rRNA (uracil1498-N3)-methyltransferase
VPDGGDPVAAPHRAAWAAAGLVYVADLERPSVTVDDAHHLVRVLRLRPGESVMAADGRGSWRPCRFRPPATGGRPSAEAEDQDLLEPDGPVTGVPAPTPLVTVGFVPVKGDRPEWVVQKLTEAGVDRIVVLRSTRAVVRWEGDRADRNLDRLRRVAREAAAQSRRPWLPDLVGLLDLPALNALVAPAPLALAHPGGDPPSVAMPALAVGPEGGWDPSELAGGDYPTVGLGPTILRAETAALAGGLLLCALRNGLVEEPLEDPPGPDRRR